MAGHSPSGFFGKQNSWSHLSQQVFQVLKQKNSPRPSRTTTIFYFWYVVPSLKCCYFYARCNGTHTFQKVQAFSHQSTEYFPRSLGDHQEVDLTLTEPSEACSSLDVVAGSFVSSWMSRHCTLEVMVVGRPVLRTFTTVPCFCHLWLSLWFA